MHTITTARNPWNPAEGNITLTPVDAVAHLSDNLNRAMKRIAELEAERNALLEENAGVREALETLNHAAKVAIFTEYGNSFDEDTPLTIRLLDGTCDAAEAALTAPATDAALDRVRKQAQAEALAVSADIYLRTGSPATSVDEIADELRGGE